MRGWFLTLAAFSALAEIAGSLAPPGWREHIGRIATLAALATLLVPLGNMTDSREILTDGFEALLNTAEIGEETADAGRDAWTGAAELAFRTAEELGIDPVSMTVTFREEEGSLRAIDVTVPRCPWNLRAALEEELEGYFGAACTVSADADEGRRG